MDGWNTSSFWEGLFSGAMLILRCNYILSSDLWKREPLEGEWALQMKAWAGWPSDPPKTITWPAGKTTNPLKTHFLHWKCGFSTLFSLVFCQQLRAPPRPDSGTCRIFPRCVLPPWPPAAVALAGGWWAGTSLQPRNFAFFHPQKKGTKTY